MNAAAQEVTFEFGTGAIIGAGPVQYAGLRAMAIAAKTLHPLDDFGFSYAARLLRTLFPSGKRVKVLYDQERTFVFPYGDGYWSLLLNRNHIYEEEVEVFLRSIKDVDYVFIDCGANYGFWSVHVTSQCFGAHPSVAIEADDETFALLDYNRILNDGRFDAMRRAVSSEDGTEVHVYGTKHEARTIVPGNPAARRQPVSTIRLDSLAGQPALRNSKPVVLKLDVEGAEIDALNGGTALLERDLVIVYEDHGSDPSHMVTRHLMDVLGMRVFAYERGGFVPVASPADLDARKKNPRRGYDFFATKSEFWQDRLAAPAGRPER